MSAEDILKIPSAEPAEPVVIEVTLVVEPPAEPAVKPAAVNSPLPNMTETDEPWNVINARASHAEAMNKYTEVKAEFDANFNAEPEPEPMGPEVRLAPIPVGRRLIPDPAKYVIDRGGHARTELRRRPD